MSGKIRISEIFGPTIQGEGPLIGRPTIFVRTAGCDYRCAWCDTSYAVLPENSGSWDRMTSKEVLERIDKLSGGVATLVSLSGGNPAMQPLGELIAMGRRCGYRFALETQGSLPRPWFKDLDWLILSPKPPSSGMETDWKELSACLSIAQSKPAIAMKVVVFDDGDYLFAKEVQDRHADIPLYLQVGNPAHAAAREMGTPAPLDEEGLKARFRWLVERAASERWFNVTILPQLHLYAWGDRRGV